MRPELLACGLVACGGAPHPAHLAACPTTGPVAVASQADLIPLAGCRALPGLVVRGGAPIDLGTLAALHQIDGDLVVGPTLALSDVNLANVVRVTGTVRITGNGSVGGVYLTSLASAAAVEVVDNASLATLSLPALATVPGHLVLQRNPDLSTVNTGALRAVGGGVMLDSVGGLTLWLGDAIAASSVTIVAPVGLPADELQRLFGPAAGAITDHLGPLPGLP